MPTPAHYNAEFSALVDEYQKKGIKEAQKHRPSKDATHPDQYEADLRAQAAKWMAAEQQIFGNGLTETSRIVMDTQQKLIELQAKVKQLVSDQSVRDTIDMDLAAERAGLVAATEARMRAEVDWKAFRAKNNIHEEARYPDSLIHHFGLVALCVVFETIVNAFFYENAQGLLGGAMVALAISILNMGGAMGLGYFFRNQNLVDFDKKIYGWLALLVFIAGAIYCNALFSAFRAEYQMLADPTDYLLVREAFTRASGEAIKIYVFDMQIADISSFVLFGFGLLLSIVAFWKGYTLDDKHPGYGAKDRSLKERRTLELEKQAELRVKIRDFLQRQRTEVQAAVHEPTQLVTRISTRSAELQQSVTKLHTQAQAIQRDYALVLGAYRQANLSIRANDAPAYFKHTEDLVSLVNSDAAPAILSDIEELQAEIAETRTRHEGPLNDKLKELAGNATNALGHTFDVFIAGVEEDAREAIDRSSPTISRTVAVAGA
ncbi:transmembrane protein [Azoarcus sp. CIB]|uniref:hypothetical protein n=1 Tax=Aromatoleum sp. (strain CIB) TaxID=198107 RepID=UPI00067BCF3D|nr:hypothetical protein [Azoarcus sp. CIB]AKU11323.1 transmembrane protein [Azoarcus sp. CIB]